MEVMEIEEPSTEVATLPKNLSPQAQEDVDRLDRILHSAGFQKEEMVRKLYEIRKINNASFSIDDAELEITDFYADDVILEDAAKALNKARYSPLVSRETQTATLKGMILDYQQGKNRKGLGAISVLKAIELLNRMTGYDAPQKVEVAHDVRVNVFPIVGSTFKGELPPLDIIDIEGSVVVTQEDLTPSDNLTPEELFP